MNFVNVLTFLCSLVLLICAVVFQFFTPTKAAQNLYVDENALLPSMSTSSVVPRLASEMMALHTDMTSRVSRELPDEFLSSVTVAMKRVGLESYKISVPHLNATLIIAIVRAKKGAGTESIVLSGTISTDALLKNTVVKNASWPSTASLMMTLANQMQDVKWLDKDIVIVLVHASSHSLSQQTLEHWLAVYQDHPAPPCTGYPALLLPRHGLILAAFHLDIDSWRSTTSSNFPTHITLLPYGALAQLPNLDLLSMMTELATGSEIPLVAVDDWSIFQSGSSSVASPDTVSLTWPFSLLQDWRPLVFLTHPDRLKSRHFFNRLKPYQPMLRSFAYSISGMQCGAHQSFLSRGITALTLKAVVVPYGPTQSASFIYPAHTLRSKPPKETALSLLRLQLTLETYLEQCIRAINNLHETLHHSHFFYVITGVQRFSSMSKYTTGFLLMHALGIVFRINALTSHVTCNAAKTSTTTAILTNTSENATVVENVHVQSVSTYMKTGPAAVTVGVTDADTLSGTSHATLVTSSEPVSDIGSSVSTPDIIVNVHNDCHSPEAYTLRKLMLHCALTAVARVLINVAVAAAIAVTTYSLTVFAEPKALAQQSETIQTYFLFGLVLLSVIVVPIFLWSPRLGEVVDLRTRGVVSEIKSVSANGSSLNIASSNLVISPVVAASNINSAVLTLCAVRVTLLLYAGIACTIMFVMNYPLALLGCAWVNLLLLLEPELTLECERPHPASLSLVLRIFYLITRLIHTVLRIILTVLFPILSVLALPYLTGLSLRQIVFSAWRDFLFEQRLLQMSLLFGLLLPSCIGVWQEWLGELQEWWGTRNVSIVESMDTLPSVTMMSDTRDKQKND